MNKFWIVLSHTYWTRFKTKSFLISTIASILFLLMVTNIPTIIDVFSDDSHDKIAVIDRTGELFTPLEKSMDSTDEAIKLIAFSGSEEEAKTSVQDDDYHALIILDLNSKKLPEATYYANNIAETGRQNIIKQQVQQLKNTIASVQAGIEQGKLEEIYAPITFETIALDKGAKTDTELNQARGIVYAMLFLLYISVMVYGQMIAMDVATEKASRIMEILISSISPIKQMFAKIFGIGLLGLTQIVVIISVGYIMIKTKKDELTGEIFDYFGIEGASITLFIYAVVFFLLGYLLYATIAAMLGSLVSRIEDVQQLIMPMMFLIIAAFLVSMFGLTMPDATIVKVSSFIPFFSPMLMFLRVGMLDVPTWEVVLSLIILVATIVIFAIIGSKVYKGGVLMYGKSGSWKNLKKAVKLSKNE